MLAAAWSALTVNVNAKTIIPVVGLHTLLGWLMYQLVTTCGIMTAAATTAASVTEYSASISTDAGWLPSSYHRLHQLPPPPSAAT